MPQHTNYLEFPARDLPATRAFFEALLGWEFESWGEEYISFKDGDLDGGFFLSEQRARQEEGSVLVIFLSHDLEASLARCEQLGAPILNPIFSFPGGRRFHFADPSGNEYAFWCKE